jgi:hypothetical protein
LESESESEENAAESNENANPNTGTAAHLPKENVNPKMAAGPTKSKRKREPESFILHQDQNNSDQRNVIIPYDQFVSFMDDNFVCIDCYGHKKRVLERENHGIATSISLTCGWGALPMLAICRVYESFDATETPHNSCMKS